MLYLLLLTQAVLVLGQFGTYECPKPWIGFEEKCYKFEMFEDTLDGAENACNNDGASLVSVNARLEHEFIVDTLKSNELENRMWFTSGRRDSQDHDKYMWEGDGTKITGFQYWLSDDARKLEGYVIVYKTDGANWGWWLLTDEARAPYICEISRSEIYKIVQEQRDFDYGVAETDPDILERGPSFSTEPQDAIYDPDTGYNYVAMECIADGNPQPTYKWYLEKEQRSREVNPFDQPRYTVTGGRLVIHNPSDATDNGNYQCRAQNKYGAILSNVVQLSFGYLLDFPKSVRDPVRVDAFSGTGIECNPPKHYPEILYSWYKDSILNFIRSSLKEYVFVSANGKLYFSSVTKDDEGDYYCLVFSPRAGVTAAEGKMSMPIPLQVRETVASIREPNIVTGFPAVYPSSPKQGDHVKIECIAWGTGDLSYNWQKVGGTLPGGHSIQDNGRVLVIPDIRIIHGGSYQCTVTRLNGQSDSATVQLPVDAEPFFTIPLQHQHLDMGSDLTWRCIANGIPTVSYAWYRNGEPLDPATMLVEDAERYTITNNVLMIRNVKPEDSGMYQCAATNLHAVRFSTAQLRVLSFMPNFYKQPLQRNTYASARGNVTIVCQPEAAPAAEITWKKDGRVQSYSSSGRVRVLPNGNLHILGVISSDEGTYTCVATNPMGTAESSGNLTLLASTSISYPPRNTVVKVNHTTFLHCQASYNPQLDLTYIWHHNNRLIEFIKIKNLGNHIYVERDPYFERGTGLNRGGLVIKQTQFFHAGEYTCTARTTADSISKSASLQVIGPPSEPAGVYGFNAMDKSIMLRWTSGSDNGRTINGFVVEGLNKHEGFWRQVKSNIRGDDLKKEQTLVEGLRPWSEYQFRVRAENALGLGNPSDPSPIYTTLAAPPTEYPKNVGGGGGKVGTLVVTWDPLPRAEQNGPGISYRIFWKKKYLASKDQWDEFVLKGEHQNKFVRTVGKTYFYQEYDVAVQAFNDKGVGPMSPPVTIRSAENLPTGVPTRVRTSPFNSTAMYVEWEPVEDTIETMKGKLLGYRLNYWKEIGEDETMAQYRPITGQTDHGLIIGLEPKTYYYVNVQVYNSAGNGPKSQEYLEETLRLAPQEAPTEVFVKVIDDTTVEAYWRGVSTDQTEEPLQGYMIRYWLQGEDIYAAKDLDAEKKTHIKIHDLVPKQVYNLRVLGYSRGGDGLMSSPTIQFILGPNCEVKEIGQQFRFIYTCACSRLHLSLLLATLIILYHTMIHV